MVHSLMGLVENCTIGMVIFLDTVHVKLSMPIKSDNVTMKKLNVDDTFLILRL